MDLLRKMKENRMSVLQDTKVQGHIKPAPTNEPVGTRSDSTSKQEIIETKPKHKKLKEYFESFIEDFCNEEE